MAKFEGSRLNDISKINGKAQFGDHSKNYLTPSLQNHLQNICVKFKGSYLNSLVKIFGKKRKKKQNKNTKNI